MALPAVVLAHQQGVGLSAYRRADRVRYRSKQAYPYPLDMRYTITPILTFARNAKTRTQVIITAYCVYCGRCRVGEIQQSSKPEAVEDELADFLKGR